MHIVLGIVGFIVGLFVWAQILYPVLLALPLALKLKKTNKITRIPWAKITIPVIASSLLLLVVSIFSTSFLIGSIPAGLLILSKTFTSTNREELLSSYPELNVKQN